MQLMQAWYLDEDGGSISADLVAAITSYERKGDGFFVWDCSACGEHNQGRSYELPQGVVYKCSQCHVRHLLLSSACDYIREALAFWEANKPLIKTGRFDDQLTAPPA